MGYGKLLGINFLPVAGSRVLIQERANTRTKLVTDNSFLFAAVPSQYANIILHSTAHFAWDAGAG
jgi:hypothetical protein